MPHSSEHIQWLTPSGVNLTTSCGKSIEVLNFEYDSTNKEMMSAWAAHFREHYCPENEIDYLRSGTELSRSEYLTQMKFPNRTALGPSIRAGDFAEILVIRKKR